MADISRFTTGWPIFAESGSAGSGTTHTADAQNEAAAAIVNITADDTITHLVYTNSSKTGTPADDSYTASIQGVDASGNPDGVVAGSVTFPNATYPVAGFGTSTSHILALGSSVSVQRGSRVAIVVQKTGATDAANFLVLRAGQSASGLGPSFPYVLTADTTPTWTKAARLPIGMSSLRSSTRTYGWPGVSIGTTTNFGGTTEAGFTFTFPSAFAGTSNTVGLLGFRVLVQATAIVVGATIVATLYSGPLAASPTTLQQTALIDTDQQTSGTSRGYEFIFPEDSLSALTPGTKYGVGLAHSTAGSSASIGSITLPDSGCKDAYPLGGIVVATRTLTDYPPSGNDTNAFAELANNNIAFVDLIFGDITIASGGAALSRVRLGM